MIDIRTTDGARAFDWINANLKLGYEIHRLKHEWEWWTWRYVRVYTATMKKPKTLEFVWGPVCERPLPPDPNGA